MPLPNDFMLSTEILDAAGPLDGLRFRMQPERGERLRQITGRTRGPPVLARNPNRRCTTGPGPGRQSRAHRPGEKLRPATATKFWTSKRLATWTGVLPFGPGASGQRQRPTGRPDVVMKSAAVKSRDGGAWIENQFGPDCILKRSYPARPPQIILMEKARPLALGVFQARDWCSPPNCRYGV